MLEQFLENLLFACRWLLAPLYLGLALALIALGVKFFQEAFTSCSTFSRRPRPMSAVLLGVLDRIAFAGHREE